jgi:hypothetical protein
MKNFKIFWLLLAIFTINIAFSQNYPTNLQKQEIQNIISRGNPLRGVYEAKRDAYSEAYDDWVKAGKPDSGAILERGQRLWDSLQAAKGSLKANRDSIIHAVDSLFDIGIPKDADIQYDPNCSVRGYNSQKCFIRICEPVIGEGPDRIAATKIHEWEHQKQKMAGRWGDGNVPGDSSFRLAELEFEADEAVMNADFGKKIKLSYEQKMEILKRKLAHLKHMLEALSAEWKDKTNPALPGTGVNETIRVTNNSAYTQTIECVISDSLHWLITPNVFSVELQPDEVALIPVVIHVPPIVEKGTMNEVFCYATTGGVTSFDFTLVHVIATVKVTPFDDVLAMRGELVNFTTIIQNMGDTPDNFHVEISNPLGWPIADSFFDVFLNPSESVHLLSSVVVPFGVEPYSANLIFSEATSLSNPLQTDKASFTLQIKELDIGPIFIEEPIGKKYLGEIATPKTKVYNYGYVESFFDVFFEIPELGYKDSVKALGLPPKTVSTVVFSPLLLMTNGIFQIETYTKVLGDINPSNDQLLSSFEVGLKEIEVASGWNIVSVPYAVSDPRKEILFPTSNSNAFTYIVPTGYEAEDSLNNREGYWLKFDEAQQISIVGDLILSDTFNVVQGWNMIGSISADIPTVAIVQNPPNIVASNYYKYKSGYKIAENIEVGNGYWIKANLPGELILSTEGLLKLPKYQSITQQLVAFNKLNIKDSYGNEQVLYFGVNDDAVSNTVDFELPPTAPLGSFDVRFESNQMLEMHNQELEKSIDFPILLNGVEPPLSISWEVTKSKSFGYRLCSYDGGKLKVNMLLRDKGSIKVNGLSANKLLLKVEPKFIPTEFALYQNYPNPFNPSTKIVFDLPFASRVDLKIFNILGQEVVTICDKLEFEEGRQEVEFSASKLASGVYFYRINAEFDNKSFTSVKKMLYMK